MNIIKKSNFKNVNWLIVDYGTHPCAYIEYDLPINLEDEIACHGGVTFNDSKDFGEGEHNYFGWDYAHYGDYSPFAPQGRKWTAKEIEEEIRHVILDMFNKGLL